MYARKDLVLHSLTMDVAIFSHQAGGLMVLAGSFILGQVPYLPRLETTRWLHVFENKSCAPGDGVSSICSSVWTV